MSETMQAIVQDRYGPPEVLALREREVPRLADDEVLIRVRAAAVHAGDCLVMRGTPFLVRMETGWSRPKPGVPGYDVAGIVEEVGRDVQRLRPGDEVFGQGRGTCAELAIAREDQLAPKPANLSFEEAAAVPVSALAALHGLRDAGKLQPGQRVLVNGASGGVGTFAIQIAKSLGAHVTGVCSTTNTDLVRSLGADEVIDYTEEDFAQGEPRYDLILDNVENRTLGDCRRALTPDGTLILNSGTGATGCAFLVRLVKPLLLSPFVRHDLRRYFSTANREDLLVLKDLAEEGGLRPVIDRTYPLSEVPSALRYLEGGHARGKVVITI